MSAYSFGGFQRFSSARNESMPASSIFCHRAGVSLMERSTRVSSGAFGGLPRPRFGGSSCVMERSVALIYRYTNIPCNPAFMCYSNSINTQESNVIGSNLPVHFIPSSYNLLQQIKAAEAKFEAARAAQQPKPQEGNHGR